MARRNHEVHTQEGEEQEGVELASLDVVLLAHKVGRGHNHHDERTHVEHTLDERHHLRVEIHAAKEGSPSGFVGCAVGQEIEHGMYEHQNDGHTGEPHHSRTGTALKTAFVAAVLGLLLARHEEVDEEGQENHCQERQFLAHA